MDPIQQAVLKTIAYADVFDYPLTAAEIHHYLVGERAARSEVQRALEKESGLSGRLAVREGHYVFPGRESTVETRRARKRVSALLWPRAIRYGTWISRLPFVRMTAVTGSLAVDNADSQADLDYLVVTQPGRVWTARALVILLVRLARQRGDSVCPNYFLSERALILPQHNLFSAHELAQMVPIRGANVLRGMWLLNGWICDYLPNAQSQPEVGDKGSPWLKKIQPAAEVLLRTPPVTALERWEMERKVRKFASLSARHPEATFGPDQCKGHFDDHSQRILAAYADRLRALEEVQLDV